MDVKQVLKKQVDVGYEEVILLKDLSNLDANGQKWKSNQKSRQNSHNFVSKMPYVLRCALFSLSFILIELIQ